MRASTAALAIPLAVAKAPAVGQAVAGSAPSGPPEGLRIHCDPGSAAIAGDAEATLDRAARLFREGRLIVMVAAGGADTVGNPSANLPLSIRRAQAAADGPVARGIPAERRQVPGRGDSERAVPTEEEEEVESRENRLVEIGWR